jgi:hypothetical protein
MGLLVVLQLAFTYAKPMQYLFHTIDLGWAEWLRIIAVASSVFILVEAEKFLLRFARDRKNSIKANG